MDKKAALQNAAEKLRLRTKGGYWIILLVLVIGLGFLATRLPPVDLTFSKRPILEITQSRVCDFLALGGQDYALCTDGTRWLVSVMDDGRVMGSEVVSPIRGIETPTPAVAVAEMLEPPEVRDALPVAQETVGKVVTIRYSYYNPALGGTNCLTFRNGVCVSTMANGQAWKPYMYEAVACPPEWPFGTTVTLDGETWTCRDRGGAIKYRGGIPWVDFLRKEPAYTYGSEVLAIVRLPSD